MRKYKRRRKNQNKIILIGMFSLLLFFSIGYAAFQTNITLTAKGNIKKKSTTIKNYSNYYINYNWSSDAPDFYSEKYRTKILNITFLGNNDVPSNAIESWDVSVDGKKGVMAYVTANTDDNTKYDLYIGADGGVIANKDSSFAFSDFPSLQNINFNNNYNTSNVTNMYAMFRLSTSLTTIDVSSFDTSNVTNMGWMFAMYDGVVSKSSNLTTIKGIENFNTANVTNMDSVFRYDIKLAGTLDLSKWNTSKFSNLNSTFDCLKSVSSINVSNWDTSNVWCMRSTFYGASKLTELNLCSWDTNKVTTMNLMFQGTPNINAIYVGNGWNTTNATTDAMFQNSKISNVTTGMCDQIIN